MRWATSRSDSPASTALRAWHHWSGVNELRTGPRQVPTGAHVREDHRRHLHGGHLHAALTAQLATFEGRCATEAAVDLVEVSFEAVLTDRARRADRPSSVVPRLVPRPRRPADGEKIEGSQPWHAARCRHVTASSSNSCARALMTSVLPPARPVLLMRDSMVAVENVQLWLGEARVLASSTSRCHAWCHARPPFGCRRAHSGPIPRATEAGSLRRRPHRSRRPSERRGSTAPAAVRS